MLVGLGTVFIALMASSAFLLRKVYPYGLVARVASRSVLAVDAAADAYALRVGLTWWLPGMAVVVGYSLVARRAWLGGEGPARHQR